MRGDDSLSCSSLHGGNKELAMKPKRMWDGLKDLYLNFKREASINVWISETLELRLSSVKYSSIHFNLSVNGTPTVFLVDFLFKIQMVLSIDNG